jgi:hypothetical protein
MAQLSSLPLFNSANLVAYYKCEDVSDSKGAYTLTNNNSVTFTGAKYGNGANFGSSNSDKSLSVSNDMGITGGAITISCWVRLLAEIGSGVYCFTDQNDTGTEVEYDIAYEYNSGAPRIRIDRTKRLVSNNPIYYTLTMGTSNFYHFALTYDTTNLRAYVNGILVGSPLATSGNGTDTGSTTDKFIIGAAQDNLGATGTFASAIIDDVGVFNTALSASDIYSIYIESNGLLNTEI